MTPKSAISLIRRLTLMIFLIVWSGMLRAEIIISAQINATEGQCDGVIEVMATGTAGPFIVELSGPTSTVQYDVWGPASMPNLCPGQYTLKVTDNLGCDKIFELEIQGCSSIDLPPYISSVTVYTSDGTTDTKVYQAFWTETYSGEGRCIQFQPNTIVFPASEVAGIQNIQRTLMVEAVANVPMQYVGLSLPGLSGDPLVSAEDDLVWRFILLDKSIVAEMVNTGIINQQLIFTGQAQNGQDLLDLKAIGGSTEACIAYPKLDGNCALDATYYQYGTDDVHVLSNCGLPLQANLVAANAPCDGMADGSLCIEVTGGVPPYQYLWENGSTTECAKDLATFGCYAVTVTDACGMELNTCFQLPLYEALGLHISTIEDRCLFQVNGGVEAFFTGAHLPLITNSLVPT